MESTFGWQHVDIVTLVCRWHSYSYPTSN